jgi:GNAT superfamily N-acetyltransferase
MTPKLQYKRITSSQTEGWLAFVKIYQASFPITEQEPLATIESRIGSRYRLYLVSHPSQDAVIGFYIIDVVEQPRYSLLTFLAVSPEHQSQGLGRQIFEHILADYPGAEDALLFIEAEPALAHFYEQSGAKKLDLNYSIPDFASEQPLVPTCMLIGTRNEPPEELDGRALREIIRHIFTDGYQLSDSDPRLQQLIQQIPVQLAVGN